MAPPTADSKEEIPMSGFSPISSTRIFWNSRKRTANGQSVEKMEEDLTRPIKSDETAGTENQQDQTPALSERRKALFEPLTPAINSNGRRPSAETLLPPPDFDSANYPRGWLIGKKRKLVNVDVVESMRRIAVQEMNRKDREIDGLNEQLEEDSRCLQHLQLQLLEERSKRAEIERENNMLQNQVSMLMNMLQENEELGDPTDDSGDPTDDS